MTSVNAPKNNHRNNKTTNSFAWMLLSGMVLLTLAFVVWQVLVLEGVTTAVPSPGLAASSMRVIDRKPGVSHPDEEAQLRSTRVNKKQRPSMIASIFDESPWKAQNEMNAAIRMYESNACEISFYNLTDEELHPRAGDRHMITPPEGGKLSLVCCETTKGNMAMVAHHKWAPIGAAHFIEMVKAKYFDTTVPLMRCMKGFLCQFGINSDPTVTKKFRGNLKDDPNWLPEGKEFRENDLGVMRFAKGYLAYAGGGKNTRGNQFILSLEANGPLAGGSPWEVPWGELVGEESFETLSKIYTGYGDDGPGQGKLGSRGMDEELKKEFPLIDYIDRCVVIDEQEIDGNRKWSRKTLSKISVATILPSSSGTKEQPEGQ